MNPHYQAVSIRANYRCEYCLAPEAIFNFHFEVEHIIPKSKNAAADLDAFDNLALCCRSCNLFKSNQSGGVDEETNEAVRLFHPRTDDWQTHFRFERSTAKIIGLSAIGRVTIVLLKLNHPAQLVARQKWIDFGLFP